jgi:hypothetical protein
VTYGIRIDIDTREAAGAWDEAVNALANEAITATRQALRIGAQTARGQGNFQDRSGALRDSIRGIMLIAQLGFAEGELQAGVSPDAPYASFVEEGTAAHVIPGPVTFKGSDGQWRTLTDVQHPGARADLFMFAGALAAEAALRSAITAAVGRMNARMAR